MKRLLISFILFLCLILPTIAGPIYDHLFIQFYQTTEGNCASVAVIKAAMDEYGDAVLDKLEVGSEGTLSFVEQDGFSGNLTREEQDQASRYAKFGGTCMREILYAENLYAIEAKRGEVEHLDGARTFENALRTLGTGENTVMVAHLLGLEQQVELIKSDDLKQFNGLVGFSEVHAIYIDNINGKLFYDAYGLPKRYKGEDGHGNSIKYTFRLKSRI